MARVFAVAILALFLLLSCEVIAQQSDEHYRVQFEAFKTKYNKEYTTDSENEHRFEIFKQNFDFITAHNSDRTASSILAVNQFADLTQQEYAALQMPPQRYDISEDDDADHQARRTASRAYVKPNIPASFDWRTKGVVSPVRNQASCGSCWSFAVAGSLESFSAIKTGQLVDFSEQHLLDCANAGNCGGGNPLPAWGYLQAFQGIYSEADYPYTSGNTGRTETCRSLPSNTHKHARVYGYSRIGAYDEDALVEAIATLGPIAVAMDASSMQFGMYAGGVFNMTNGSPGCNNYDTTHLMLAVGYTPDYFILKNQWGTGWGLSGYVYWARNHKDGICAIARYSSYPSLDPALNSGTTICQLVTEGFSQTLGCQNGGVIQEIEFASYGTPKSIGLVCGTEKLDESCHSTKSWVVMNERCVGKTSCVVSPDNGLFGDPCPNMNKWLAVRARCSSPATAAASSATTVSSVMSTSSSSAAASSSSSTTGVPVVPSNNAALSVTAAARTSWSVGTNTVQTIFDLTMKNTGSVTITSARVSVSWPSSSSSGSVSSSWGMSAVSGSPAQFNVNIGTLTPGQSFTGAGLIAQASTSASTVPSPTMSVALLNNNPVSSSSSSSSSATSTGQCLNGVCSSSTAAATTGPARTSTTATATTTGPARTSTTTGPAQSSSSSSTTGTPSNTGCSVTFQSTLSNSWTSGGTTYSQYSVTATNAGTKAISGNVELGAGSLATSITDSYSITKNNKGNFMFESYAFPMAARATYTFGYTVKGSQAITFTLVNASC
eukprot:TRINITY_DN3077_c1_g1_i2.p1 TRINITY_DN3077_c1_g1~~TRINITY_DN3077_c1_g1_i2.p1  ORF type:complete len:777 (-),score=187.40 TRINITY_DN3077_c1_g1_i2:52-2382(-)